MGEMGEVALALALVAVWILRPALAAGQPEQLQAGRVGMAGENVFSEAVLGSSTADRLRRLALAGVGVSSSFGVQDSRTLARLRPRLLACSTEHAGRKAKVGWPAATWAPGVLGSGLQKQETDPETKSDSKRMVREGPVGRVFARAEPLIRASWLRQ